MLSWLSLSLRRLLLLFIGAVTGLFAVIPHLRNQLGEFLTDIAIIAVAASSGTWLAPRTALQSPIIDAALAGRPFARRGLVLTAQALAAGMVTTVVLIVLDATLFPPRARGSVAPGAGWRRELRTGLAGQGAGARDVVVVGLEHEAASASTSWAAWAPRGQA